jgi:quinolinate synthase
MTDTKATAPLNPGDTDPVDTAWAARIRRLASQRDAVILAHNYQRPEIQEVADHVGDSLALARLAAASSASVIVLCGVYFMAETAKILSPSRTVLIPDAGAGCSLADSITADQLRSWKAEHPGAAVVAYVNTSAEVKAESDVCCTSANAAEVVSAIAASREVLFLPDQFLGAHVRRVTGRANLHVWAGECHVHAGISPVALRDLAAARPAAEIYVHPECGCGTSALWQTGTGDLPADRTRVLSTGGMLAAARVTSASEVLVATETGMLHQLRKARPTVSWEPVNPHATCHYMKMITAAALEKCLVTGGPEVFVAPAVADRARRAVEAMIAIGPAATSAVPAGAA